MYYIIHMRFGDFTRSVRERLKRDDSRFSVRQVARRVGVEPSYLSKVERNHVAPPSETKIGRLAAELGEDRDVMLALGGKIATDLQQIIRGLKAKGLGVFISDHNVRETLQVCDFAYIMNDGQILTSGVAADIIESELAKKMYLGENFTM